jgi:hypothetical protein
VRESDLRHPYEKFALAACIIGNILLAAGAIYVVTRTPEWLSGHPVIARHAESARPFLIGAILLVPAAVLAHRRSLEVVTGDSVRVSVCQLPELHEILRGLCQKINMAPVPELYVSKNAIDDYAYSYTSSHGKRNIIVLNAEIFENQINETADIATFLIARELGRIRLGHTHWLYDWLYTGPYAIPVLSNPLQHACTLSHDRYAAWLAPDSVRGLIAMAVGHKLYKKVDLGELLWQIRGYTTLTARLTTMTRRHPPLAIRLRELLDARLIDGSAGSNANMARNTALGPRAGASR